MKSRGRREKIFTGIAVVCLFASLIVCGAYFIFIKKDNPSANTSDTYSSNFENKEKTANKKNTVNNKNNSSAAITNDIITLFKSSCLYCIKNDKFI